MGNKIGFPRYILDPIQLDGDYTGVSFFLLFVMFYFVFITFSAFIFSYIFLFQIVLVSLQKAHTT